MVEEERSVFKGLVARLIGGLIGTIVMNEFQNLWSTVSQKLENSDGRQSRQSQQESESPTMKAAARIAKLGGRELTHEEKKKLGPVGVGAVRGVAGAPRHLRLRADERSVPGALVARLAAASHHRGFARGASSRRSEVPAGRRRSHSLRNFPAPGRSAHTAAAQPVVDNGGLGRAR